MGFINYLKEAEKIEDNSYVVEGLEEIEDDIILLQKSCSSLIAQMKKKKYKSDIHENISVIGFVEDLYDEFTKEFKILTKIKMSVKEETKKE